MGQSIALSTITAPRRRALLLLLVVTLAWAAIEALGPLLPDHPSGYQVVWMRYGFHVLALLVVFGPRYRTRLWRTERLPLQLLRGLFMLGMSVAFVLSVRRLPVGGVWSVFWLAPLLALALAAFVLHERTGWGTWLAAIAAYAGVLILLQPDRALLSPAAALPLGMGICFALYMLTCRLLRDEAILPSLFYTGLAVFLPLCAIMPRVWRPVSWVTGAEVAVIGILGLLLLYCLDKALELVELGAAAPLLLAAPLWSAIFESMHPGAHDLSRLILGGVILLGALAALWVVQNRRQAAGSVGVPARREQDRASIRST